MRLDYFKLGGRATTAPSLQAVMEMQYEECASHGEADEDQERRGGGVEQQGCCQGAQDEGREEGASGEGASWRFCKCCAVMRHDKPRMELFTPLRVAGAPPAAMLTSVRVTEGRYCDNGDTFRRIDSWRARSTAHLNVGRPWTGYTRFYRHSDQCEHRAFLSQANSNASSVGRSGDCPTPSIENWSVVCLYPSSVETSHQVDAIVRRSRTHSIACVGHPHMIVLLRFA